MQIEFSPKSIVNIPLLGATGRVNRVIIDSGGQVIYSVRYILNGECREVEFFEDEVTAVADTLYVPIGINIVSK